VSPEQIGLCGCWQVIAVRRERVDQDPKKGKTTDEIAMYATSLALGERTDEQMMEAIRGHWAAIENGVHYRRDVSFGEDDCRIAQRKAAHAMATLRNLAIGLYELQRERGRMEADGCKSWCRQMTVATALTMLRK
jgi:predicted transposase YbfD/YdcC